MASMVYTFEELQKLDKGTVVQDSNSKFWDLYSVIDRRGKIPYAIMDRMPDRINRG